MTRWDGKLTEHRCLGCGEFIGVEEPNVIPTHPECYRQAMEGAWEMCLDFIVKEGYLDGDILGQTENYIRNSNPFTGVK